MKLAFLGEEGVLQFRHMTFYLSDGKDNRKIVSVNSGLLKRFLSYLRITVRLFRLEPRCIVQMDSKRFVLCLLHKIWLLDIEDSSLKELTDSRSGFSDPLNFCTDDTNVYWGDYGDNAARDVVNIYKLSSDLSIKVIFQFKAGKIRHIHNIIYDKEYQQFWVLTGDTEKGVGIYTSDFTWNKVTPVVTGQQDYRSVVAFPHEGGLLYATDAVDRENHIFSLKGNNIVPLATINGSCIYGTETKDYYIFSTTVEPPEGRGLLNLFTYRLGKGIKSRESHIIAVSKKTMEVNIIERMQKDIWPMKLFQYGMATFPIGQKLSEKLCYNIIACKGDGKSKVINLTTSAIC